MYHWTSRLRRRTRSNTQQLEAGLARPRWFTHGIAEESGDIADNAIPDSDSEEKDQDEARLSGIASSSIPDNDHVEDALPHTDTTLAEDQRSSPFKRFNWHRSRKQNGPIKLVIPGFDDNMQSSEKHEQTQNDHDDASSDGGDDTSRQALPKYTDEARHLVRTFTSVHNPSADSEPRDGRRASSSDQNHSDRHFASRENYKPSIFGAILKSRLNDLQESRQHYSYLDSHFQPAGQLETGQRLSPQRHKHERSASRQTSSPGSGSTTPRPKWYEKPERSSVASLLAQAGMSSASTALPGAPSTIPTPHSSHLKPSGLISTAVDLIHGATATGRNVAGYKNRNEDDVVAEVADIIARRRYIIKLCGALMQFGAPTHRLEDYLGATARALLIDAQFMYTPGSMMCTFIDSTIQSNSVELVRKREGLDFGRLKDVFDVYKCVIHEKYTAQDGIAEIEKIQERPDPFSLWFRIFIFGMASVFVGPFSFNSRPIDFAPIFVLGCALGFLHLKVVPRSAHFSNVFEVFACVLAAFIARGLGSIKWPDGSSVFCFSAIAQSSIAMILPGFMVLNSALELQGRSVVSGSVRMVYAIIYVLFLGFGLLVGTTVFGLIKRDATNDVTCSVPNWFSPADAQWKLLYTRFLWAPLFACCMAIFYQAHWRQLPVMALIATCGHQANFWISTQLSSNLQVANAVGAFAIGCMANLYSRLFHGLAAAAMLPAIYCQVPGGLAASGSLVAGINSSNQIFGNSSSVSVINNGTQGFITAQEDPNSVYGGTIFNVGYGMVQVAIGISVGLYMSALVVYPYGKRNSGLFSF